MQQNEKYANSNFIPHLTCAIRCAPLFLDYFRDFPTRFNSFWSHRSVFFSLSFILVFKILRIQASEFIVWFFVLFFFCCRCCCVSSQNEWKCLWASFATAFNVFNYSVPIWYGIVHKEQPLNLTSICEEVLSKSRLLLGWWKTFQKSVHKQKEMFPLSLCV